MSDVIVVGGGPAGSTAAWSLARAGRSVTLLDAARFPRLKLCAGWVTPAVWRALEIDPASYPHTLQPFSKASLEIDGRRHETRWPRVVSYGIVRKEFDHYLLQRAAAAGATVHEARRVQSVESRRGGVTVTTSDGRQFEAPWVIGAGGHNCPVARRLGDVSRDEAVVLTRESETRVGTDQLRALTPSHGTPELFVEPDLRGYGWYFTKGDFLNLGLGCLGTGRDLHRRFEAMISRLHADGRLPPELALEPFRGHAYAVRLQAPRRAAGERFLLVGDAAGLARPLSGEGIGPAVESARLAAETLLEQGDAAASVYARRLADRFGPAGGGWVGRIARHLPHAVAEALGRAVCRAPALRRRWIFEGAFGMG